MLSLTMTNYLATPVDIIINIENSVFLSSNISAIKSLAQISYYFSECLTNMGEVASPFITSPMSIDPAITKEITKVVSDLPTDSPVTHEISKVVSDLPVNLTNEITKVASPFNNIKNYPLDSFKFRIIEAKISSPAETYSIKPSLIGSPRHYHLYYGLRTLALIPVISVILALSFLICISNVISMVWYLISVKISSIIPKFSGKYIRNLSMPIYGPGIYAGGRANAEFAYDWYNSDNYISNNANNGNSGNRGNGGNSGNNDNNDDNGHNRDHPHMVYGLDRRLLRRWFCALFAFMLVLVGDTLSSNSIDVELFNHMVELIRDGSANFWRAFPQWHETYRNLIYNLIIAQDYVWRQDFYVYIPDSEPYRNLREIHEKLMDLSMLIDPDFDPNDLSDDDSGDNS